METPAERVWLETLVERFSDTNIARALALEIVDESVLREAEIY